jgi:hypothetical protein
MPQVDEARQQDEEKSTMPVYTFRCNDTGKLFEIKRSIREYDPDSVRSPYTGSANVSRVITRVTLGTPAPSTPGTTALDSLGNQDPKQLARTMRHLADASGQKTSNQFDEVVRSLESGKRPGDLKSAGMSAGMDAD